MSSSESSQPETFDRIAAAMDRITHAWRSGQPDLMAPSLDEQIVMVAPDFSTRLRGRTALIETFRRFLDQAQVLTYQQGKLDIDRVGHVAIAQYPFEMVYQREGSNWRSTGWDVWVFEQRGADWIAVWRTMQALEETPASPGPPAG
jgi:hypothetical protein